MLRHTQGERRKIGSRPRQSTRLHCRPKPVQSSAKRCGVPLQYGLRKDRRSRRLDRIRRAPHRRPASPPRCRTTEFPSLLQSGSNTFPMGTVAQRAWTLLNKVIEKHNPQNGKDRIHTEEPKQREETGSCPNVP